VEVEAMKKEKLHGEEIERRTIIKPDVAAREGFKWDGKDDTTRKDANPLYLERVRVAGPKHDGFSARRKRKGKGGGETVALHWSEKLRSDMTSRDWRIFREDHKMSTRGGRVPHPARSWEETGLPDNVLAGVRTAGYVKPSAIQMQAIPCALLGRDVIGVAETGSGKTAAFVLPMLVYIQVSCSR
jgi:ATP-dependent RNA helicase DDX23/PRP28